MTFTVTGTASGIPVADRRHASLLLRHADGAILFDAGDGTAAALHAQTADPGGIAAVFISHTHADHVAGLPLLLQGMHLDGRETPLDLLVPPGREDWFQHWLHGMYIFAEKWSFPIRLRSLEGIVTPLPGVTVTAFPNAHLDRVRDLAERHGMRAESYSFRIDGPGIRAVLSSDIAGVEDVAAAAATADLLFIDSTHVPLTDILALAARHEKLRVVCTHIPPELDLDAARQAAAQAGHAGARVTFARDGMVFETEQRT